MDRPRSTSPPIRGGARRDVAALVGGHRPARRTDKVGSPARPDLELLSDDELEAERELVIRAQEMIDRQYKDIQEERWHRWYNKYIIKT